MFKTLHWLPIQFRIDYKILLLTYKVLKGLAPVYLSELLIPYSPPRLLLIPRISRITMGGRAFSYRAPILWNNLPRHLRASDTLSLNAGSKLIYLANPIAKWSTVLEMVGRYNSAFKNLHESRCGGLRRWFGNATHRGTGSRIPPLPRAEFGSLTLE